MNRYHRRRCRSPGWPAVAPDPPRRHLHPGPPGHASLPAGRCRVHQGRRERGREAGPFRRLHARRGTRCLAGTAAWLRPAELILTTPEREQLGKVSPPPLIYPHWHQAKTARDRLSPADLSLLGPYL